MPSALVRGVACALLLALGTITQAQTTGTRAPAENDNAEGSPPTSAGPAAEPEEPPKSDEATPSSPPKTLLERFQRMLSPKEDPDGQINTDRPTFTPANTVVPVGRLQIESGFTFNLEQSGTNRSYVYDLPELAMRYGLVDRVEFRTFWLGETFDQAHSLTGGPGRGIGGYSDMEVGFKWQLFAGDKERKWIPTTALITSIMAPTGGTSLLSSQTVEPYINLIYGWGLTDKWTLAGSTGYLGIRQQPTPGSGQAADNFQRFHQSLVAFYSPTEKTTLFYEWYVLTFTNAADNRPTHFMDGGVLYRPVPNIQFDLRAGFGLSGRPDDFFTGAGFSFRF
jgi:Putative MetA-pathway of phenol degradation